MTNYHQKLLSEIKKTAKRGRETSEDANYLGSSHIHYGLSVPQRAVITDNWIRNHQHLTFEEFIDLLNSLFNSDSYEEKTLAGSLLRRLTELRVNLNIKLLDGWLGKLSGWGEIDSLCQSIFSAGELLANWNDWITTINKLAKSDNPNKNRAALVFLTRPVRESQDIKLADLALETIGELKDKKDILVTKAISWLLRDLIKNHKARVEDYLKINRETIPKIAVRETENKLKTGKK